MLEKLPENLYRIRGYCLLVGLLGVMGNAISVVKEVQASWQETAWKSKLYGWNHFVDFLIEEKGLKKHFDSPMGL